MKNTFLLAATIAVTLISTEAFASGGYSGSGGGFSNSGQQQRKVDQTYEVGKSIFNGSQRGAPKLSYCIEVEGEKVPVKRKSLKSFKNASFNDLASNLYDCAEPDTTVAEKLTNDNLIYVLYYLNKRHKLGLKRS